MCHPRVPVIVNAETTFPQDLTDPAQIEAGVTAMADDVWAWCEKANARGRTVTVKIKWSDFQISTRSRSLEMTIQTREELHQVALDLIRSAFPPPKGVRLVGVKKRRGGSPIMNVNHRPSPEVQTTPGRLISRRQGL